VLLTARRDAAGRQRVGAVLAFVVIVLLALLPTAYGARDMARRRRDERAYALDRADPIGPGPQWTREVAAGRATTGRERAGAAR
jgi:hypothetical protein